MGRRVDLAAAAALGSQAVRRACELIGVHQLAERMEVSRALIESWLSGRGEPPPGAFIRLMRLIRAVDPDFGRI